MHHRAFGRRIEEFDVVVVEDSRPMQTILRSILTACGIERLRVFD
jgi:two-component system chemotaxis response regulator CheY